MWGGTTPPERAKSVVFEGFPNVECCFPARAPVLSRWRRAFYLVKWRCNFYNLILPDKIPENRDPVKKILIASYGTITLPSSNHSPITK